MEYGKSEQGNPPFDFRFLCVTPHARSPAGPLWRFRPPLRVGRNLHRINPHSTDSHKINLMSTPSVAALRMNPRMARLAQRHKVSLVMRPALCQRQLMVYLLHRSQQPLFLTLLTERVLCGIAVTDSFPSSAVAFAGRVSTLELLVVLFHNLGMLLTINAVRKVRTSGITARSLWFSWHSPCLLSGHKESPAG